MIQDLVIVGDATIWGILEASYTRTSSESEWDTLFQWYVDWEAIEWANGKKCTVLQGWFYVVAVIPVDVLGNEWDTVYSPNFIVVEKVEEPIQKEYLVKLYDKDLNFLKVVPAGIITNNLSYTETINAGQGQLTLNLNLPLDTDYFDNVRYIKVFMFDNQGTEDKLLYTGYLSKFSREYSNNAENIKVVFLSLYSLFTEVYYKSGTSTEFTKTADPSNIIKEIITQFNTVYSWLISYTEYSIENYWDEINIEVNDNKMSEVIENMLEWLSFYFFVWADGICYFKRKPETVTHNFTYAKDVTALSIPEDYEQVINAVRVQYWYIWGPHSWITWRAEDQQSITKFGRREQTVINQNIYWETAANIYRNSILNKYSKWKQNINLTINALYPIEDIHPWDTIRIRNLDLEIEDLTVNTVKYQYEQVQLQIEYSTNLAKEIFNQNNL